jgi:hypothetical protein
MIRVKIFSLKKLCKIKIGSTFLLFLVIQCHLTFAQDFKIDSILLERKTISLNDSANISVVKKVFTKCKKTSNYLGVGQDLENYVISTEYWLLWDNSGDSVQILYRSRGQLTDFHISTRQLQNKFNVVVLECAEIMGSIGMTHDSNRIFQIINLDNKSFLFIKTEYEHSTMTNGGAHGDFRHDIDTYSSEYSLSFDDKDNITLKQTKNEVLRGARAKVEKRKIRPDQYYVLTQKEDKLYYLISHNK